MKYNSIGKQIKYYRSQNNLTQQQLADKIGITWEMISRYERGTSSPMQKLEEISKALKVHPAQLLEESTQDVKKSYIIPEENIIPVFIKRPVFDEFVRANTQYSQSAPDWIIKIDRGVFVIDPSILDEHSERIAKDGPIYVSPNSEIQNSSLILADVKGKLMIDSYGSIGRSNRVFGAVICQEIKFN